ncbi:unnamed protein product [Linum tenue]|uniref:Uncharacterized protein n=1 Tax=Linum tenue TaxID=586396 RepID=A0AAV0QXA2_9ROSI|nr:unnamed protein product [Linum tenue]
MAPFGSRARKQRQVASSATN